MTDVKIAAARQAQSAADKQSLKDKLLSKKARTKTITVQVDGDTIEMTFKALSAHDLDKLQAKYPPTAEQRVQQGLSFNPETFAPALVSACLVDPELSNEEATEMWTSGNWSTGELGYLFGTASDLCMEGMNVPFNGTV